MSKKPQTSPSVRSVAKNAHNTLGRSRPPANHAQNPAASNRPATTRRANGSAPKGSSAAAALKTEITTSSIPALRSQTAASGVNTPRSSVAANAAGVKSGRNRERQVHQDAEPNDPAEPVRVTVRFHAASFKWRVGVRSEGFQVFEQRVLVGLWEFDPEGVTGVSVARHSGIELEIRTSALRDRC